MKSLLMIVAAVAYLFWPYDVMPDFVPGLGWVDDLLVLAYLLAQLREGKLPKVPPRRRRRNRPPEADAKPPWDPYAVLGLEPGASPEQVKKAYREMIAQYHPDKVAHLGEELRETAQRKTLEIKKAYDELTKS